MTAEESRKIEAFFAVFPHSFTGFEGFFVQKMHAFSPLRVYFETINVPLLSYLREAVTADPALRVLTALPLPTDAEHRSYTLYRMGTLTAPVAVGLMVRASDSHRTAMATLMTEMYLATEGTPLPPADAEAFADGNRTDTYLWEAGGEITAMARVAFRGDTYARINTVVTHPDHRGKGYAAMLVGHLAALLQAEGLVPTILADKENAVTNRLYARLGFQPMGNLYEYRFAAALTPRESALTCGCFDDKERRQ